MISAGKKKSTATKTITPKTFNFLVTNNQNTSGIRTVNLIDASPKAMPARNALLFKKNIPRSTKAKTTKEGCPRDNAKKLALKAGISKRNFLSCVHAKHNQVISRNALIHSIHQMTLADFQFSH